jgi:hypothetical protein
MSAGCGMHLNYKADTVYLPMKLVKQLPHIDGRINISKAKFHKVW